MEGYVIYDHLRNTDVKYYAQAKERRGYQWLSHIDEVIPLVSYYEAEKELIDIKEYWSHRPQDFTIESYQEMVELENLQEL